MHLSYLILKIGCKVDVDPSIPQSKFTFFDKHSIGLMQYIKDEHGNYVKKPDKKKSEEHEAEKPKDELPKPPVQSLPPSTAAPDA